MHDVPCSKSRVCWNCDWAAAVQLSSCAAEQLCSCVVEHLTSWAAVQSVDCSAFQSSCSAWHSSSCLFGFKTHFQKQVRQWTWPAGVILVFFSCCTVLRSSWRLSLVVVQLLCESSRRYKTACSSTSTRLQLNCEPAKLSCKNVILHKSDDVVEPSWAEVHWGVILYCRQSLAKTERSQERGPVWKDLFRHFRTLLIFLIQVQRERPKTKRWSVERLVSSFSHFADFPHSSGKT